MTIDKTIVTSMAEKYRLAESMVFAKLQKWQKDAITEDRKTGHDSSLLRQFCQDVIKMAERMETAPPDAKPPKAIPHNWGEGESSETPSWHDKNGANGNESENIY